MKDEYTNPDGIVTHFHALCVRHRQFCGGDLDTGGDKHLGVDTVWTNTSGQSWETTADRAVDEIYRVALTIIDDTGTATESSFTLYYGLHLVTDRTLSDVESVKKLAEAIKSGVATEEQVQEYLNVHHLLVLIMIIIMIVQQ